MDIRIQGIMDLDMTALLTGLQSGRESVGAAQHREPATPGLRVPEYEGIA